MQLGRITASLLAILLVASSCLASSCAARCESSSATPSCHTGTDHQHSMDANMANMEPVAACTTSASSVSTALLDLCRHHICAQQQLATDAERNTHTAPLVSASSALPETALPLPDFCPRIPIPETPPPGTLLPPFLRTILRV